MSENYGCCGLAKFINKLWKRNKNEISYGDETNNPNDSPIRHPVNSSNTATATGGGAPIDTTTNDTAHTFAVETNKIDETAVDFYYEKLALMSKKYQKGVRVREIYKFGPQLGSGGFAIVREITKKETGEKFACKIMTLPPKGAIVSDQENSREDIFKEIEILSHLTHPNIVGLLEFYTDDKCVYLVSELLKGGELLDAVLENTDGYSEQIARQCFAQLLQGVYFLHSNSIAHRDLKLENLLLVTKGDITCIKITDFGLAKATANNNGQMTTVVGTPQYVAPEIVQGIPGFKYNIACDMWSAGVILFILLGGYPPFYEKSDAALFDSIRNGRWDFNDPVWDNISNDAKSLISGLLEVEPDKRLTAKKALEHPWLELDVSSTPLSLTQANLKKSYKSKWQAVYKLVKAANAFKDLTSVPEES